MPSMIVKHTVDGKDFYLVWSTVVDAPVTYPGTLKQIRNYWLQEYGRRGLEDLDRRIARAHDDGRPWTKTVDEIVTCNRAGADETRLTTEQFIDFWFVRRGKGKQPTGTKPWEED